MSFWLYDPKSFKDSALFPTGGIGNFLNTLTLVLIAMLTIVKSKFPELADNRKLMIYGGVSLAVIVAAGMILCRNETSPEVAETVNFDLSFD